MGKVDYFVDFGNRSYFYQVISYGSKIPVLVNCKLMSYAHIFDSCQQDEYAVWSITENTVEVIKNKHPQIGEIYSWRNEVGCYHDNFILAAARDAGRQVGISVMQYDFSDPQCVKDVCDRILCPIK